MASIRNPALGLVLASTLLALAACSEEPDTAYEAGVEDESGELIVSDPETPAVPVDLPSAQMTNVPADEADAATDAPTSAPEPAR